MTDDIIDRLRPLSTEPGDIYDEAASTIERLRLLVDGELGFRELGMKIHDGTVTIKGVMGDGDGGTLAMRFLAALMFNFILGEDGVEPPNYRSGHFTLRPAGEHQSIDAWMEVVKPGGKSSHQIRTELESKVAALEARLAASA